MGRVEFGNSGELVDLSSATYRSFDRAGLVRRRVMSMAIDAAAAPLTRRAL